MTTVEADLVAAWHLAAKDLGFTFTSPFVAQGMDGVPQEYLGLVHCFGAKAGTLVSVLNQPSEKQVAPKSHGFYRSILGPGYKKYDRQSFIDTLNDWNYFGPVEKAPVWYSGKSWS